MIKKNFTLLFLSLSLFAFSQENLLNLKHSLKASSSHIKDVIPIVNEKTGETSFFIADSKNLYGYKLNSDFKVIDKIISQNKGRKYKTLIGSRISDDGSYLVFLTNKKQDKFSSIQFSFTENKTTTKEFELKKGVKFIQTVNLNNNFYLIAANKLTNRVFIYSFDKNGTLKTNNIDTRSLRFVNSNGQNIKLTSLLIKSKNIKKFEENTPNSIELTSEHRKMYIRKNGTVLVSFDHHKMFTQVLEIDLNNFQATSFQFNKPLLGEKAKRSNSYINGENVFTITATNEKFTVEILDFKTGNLIKEYGTNKNDEITFKNTPIIQEGGMYSSYRELGKTKRFLRRITKGNTGISARKIGKQFQVVVGGYIEQRGGGGGMMMPFGGIPIGAIGAATVFFNPTQLAFNSFTNNKATRIECLFDQNFNHVEGEIKKNAFDKMQEVKTNTKGSTVFKYKDFYVKTKYNSLTRNFSFVKFTD